MKFWESVARFRRVLRPQATVRGEPPHIYPVPPDVGIERTKAALAALDEAGASASRSALDDESPVFVCAVGWRVGSTLLQRICCTDPNALIWGEPLGNMSFIPRMTEAVCIARPGGWPVPGMWLSEGFISGQRESLHREFVANLFPPAADFRTGIQRLIHDWLGGSAKRLGFTRWGLKETRLSASDALFLRWLFPRAVFLPVIRNPIDAYRSCLDDDGRLWVEPRANHPDSFAAHWNRLAMSWIEAGAEFRVPVIKFEDVATGRYEFDALRRATGLDLKPEKALSVKSGATVARGSLPSKTQTVIRRRARDGMRQYGYS